MTYDANGHAARARSPRAARGPPGQAPRRPGVVLGARVTVRDRRGARLAEELAAQAPQREAGQQLVVVRLAEDARQDGVDAHDRRPLQLRAEEPVDEVLHVRPRDRVDPQRVERREQVFRQDRVVHADGRRLQLARPHPLLSSQLDLRGVPRKCRRVERGGGATPSSRLEELLFDLPGEGARLLLVGPGAGDRPRAVGPAVEEPPAGTVAAPVHAHLGFANTALRGADAERRLERAARAGGGRKRLGVQRRRGRRALDRDGGADPVAVGVRAPTSVRLARSTTRSDSGVGVTASPPRRQRRGRARAPRGRSSTASAGSPPPTRGAADDGVEPPDQRRRDPHGNEHERVGRRRGGGDGGRDADGDGDEAGGGEAVDGAADERGEPYDGEAVGAGVANARERRPVGVGDKCGNGIVIINPLFCG